MNVYSILVMEQTTAGGRMRDGMKHTARGNAGMVKSRHAEEDGRKLSRDAINALPLFHFSGKVSLVRKPEDMDYALRKLIRKANGKSPHILAPDGKTEATQVLGFDTETRPSFRKGKSYTPSLIQLALEDEVFLFHLKWMPLGRELISILEDAAIIKTGVAVHDDMRFLAKLAPFTPSSVVDLGEVAARNGIENRGLRGLAAFFLGMRISKGEQCSNWGNSALSPRQIRYAATDAWISRAVYFSMREAGLDFSSAHQELSATKAHTSV